MYLVVLLVLVNCASTQSKGTMPPVSDAQQSAAAMPDFIAVGGRNGEIVGYVSRNYFLQGRAGQGRGAAGPWPVYADDLRTIVGQLLPGKGFVPRGVDPDSIPDVPVEVGPSARASGDGPHRVAAYVRVAAPGEAWIASVSSVGVITTAMAFDPGMGVACISPAEGGRISVIDGNPEVGPRRERAVLYVESDGGASSDVWVDVGSSSAVSHGFGVPDWWPSAPEAC